MRVVEKRWGEVSIKKQGEGKNRFDETRSFSIVQTKNHYEMGELKDLLELTVNLTEIYEAKELKRRLGSLLKQGGDE